MLNYNKRTSLCSQFYKMILFGGIYPLWVGLLSKWILVSASFLVEPELFMKMALTAIWHLDQKQ